MYVCKKSWLSNEDQSLKLDDVDISLKKSLSQLLSGCWEASFMVHTYNFTGVYQQEKGREESVPKFVQANVFSEFNRDLEYF